MAINDVTGAELPLTGVLLPTYYTPENLDKTLKIRRLSVWVRPK